MEVKSTLGIFAAFELLDCLGVYIPDERLEMRDNPYKAVRSDWGSITRTKLGLYQIFVILQLRAGGAITQPNTSVYACRLDSMLDSVGFTTL